MPMFGWKKIVGEKRNRKERTGEKISEKKGVNIIFIVWFDIEFNFPCSIERNGRRGEE